MPELLAELKQRMPFFRSPALAESQPGDAADRAGFLWRIAEFSGKRHLLLASFTAELVECAAILPVAHPDIPRRLEPFQVVFLALE